MKIDRTHRLEPDPLVTRLLGDIAEATEHLQHGRYDDALATLQAWEEGEPLPTPDFGDRLAPRRAWADLTAILPTQLWRPLARMPLWHMAEMVATVRCAEVDDPDRIEVLRQCAAGFGLRLVREVDEDAANGS